MSESRLLDWKKRTDLVATWADDADGPRDQQKDEIRREREREARRRHERSADDQRAAASEPVGPGREPERDQRVADERECEQEANLRWSEPQSGQVQDQHDGERTVGDEPRKPRQE